MIRFFILALLLAPVQRVEAGPREVFGKVAHALANHVTLDFAAGGSSAIFAAGSYDCRHDNGPEFCTAKYGSIRGIVITDAAGTGVAIVLSELGRKQGFKEWFVPELATAIGNTAFGINQWRKKNAKPEMDFSRSSFAVRK